MVPFCCLIYPEKPEFASRCQNENSPNKIRAGGTQMVKTGEAYRFANSFSDIPTNTAGCQEMKGLHLFLPAACDVSSSCCELQQLIDCSNILRARRVPV